MLTLTFGLSAAGLGVVMAKWRIPSVILAAGLLVTGLMWRRRAIHARCAADGSCAPGGPSRRWWGAGIAVAAVVALVLFPVYAVGVDALGRSTPTAGVGLVSSHLLVGMTCGGCEGHMEQAIGGLPGVVAVDASYESATVNVQWSSAPDLALIEGVVSGLGYELFPATDDVAGRHGAAPQP
jgi:copper chaperone CopZ